MDKINDHHAANKDETIYGTLYKKSGKITNEFSEKQIKSISDCVVFRTNYNRYKFFPSSGA